MKQISLLFLFLVSFFSYGQTLVGNYESHFGYRYSTLKLNADSTYVKYNKDCTYRIETNGKWQVVGDTLYFEVAKMYYLGQKKRDRKEVNPGTSAGNNFHFIASLKKCLIKPDSLILFRENKSTAFENLCRVKSK